MPKGDHHGGLGASRGSGGVRAGEASNTPGPGGATEASGPGGRHGGPWAMNLDRFLAVVAPALAVGIFVLITMAVLAATFE